MRDSGYRERGNSTSEFDLLDFFQRLRIGNIDLRQGNDFFSSRQIPLVRMKFVQECVIIFFRILAGAFDEEHQNARSLDMSEKLNAKASSFMRPFDESGDVRNGETLSDRKSVV
jgi:hypothetical protein